jgi:hypothetical protein
VLVLLVGLLAGWTAVGAEAPIAVRPDLAGTEIGAHGWLVLDLPDPDAVASLRVTLPADAPRVLLPDGNAVRRDDGWAVPIRLLLEGTHEVGALDVNVTTTDGRRQTLKTAAFALEVAAPGAERAPAQEYSQPFAAPPNWTRRALVALVAAMALALLAALVLLLWRRRRRRPVAGVPLAAPELPPLDEARRALGELASLALFRTHGSKAHYAALSLLLRRYLERTCGVPALELTEDEVRDFVRRRLAARAGVAPLGAVFERAALAKFARWEAEESVVREDLGAAGAFLDAEAERERLAAAARAARPAGEAA